MGKARQIIKFAILRYQNRYLMLTMFKYVVYGHKKVSVKRDQIFRCYI